MARTTVMLPDELVDRLRHVARRRRVSVAALVRDAVEHEYPPTDDEPLGIVGLFDGPADDASARSRELAAEAMAVDYERQRRDTAAPGNETTTSRDR